MTFEDRKRQVEGVRFALQHNLGSAAPASSRSAARRPKHDGQVRRQGRDRLTKPNDDPDTRIEIEGRTIQAGVPAHALGAFRAAIPLGRAGTPEEAAGGIYLMCAPESDYVSGQVLIVGGGISV